MSASPNRQAVIIGLFVAFGLSILAGAILTIGDINDTFTHKITVTAVFDEVGGLQQGDNIWFSGLKVGTVKSLTFEARPAGGSEVVVQLKVDRNATAFIPSDVLAKLGSDGLIGSKIVVLYGGTASAPTLADGGTLAVGVAVSTEEIMTMLQTNNRNLLAITTDLKGITGHVAAGDGTLGRLLKDDALYTDVSDTVGTLKAASADARAMTASLSTFAGKLNRVGGLPNDLVTDRSSYAVLTGSLGQIQAASSRASELMGGLADGASNPATPVGALLHEGPAGEDVKATLANLNRGSALLNDDLEALQHNFLLRGFFRRRERATARARATAVSQTPAGQAPVGLTPAGPLPAVAP